MQQSEEFRVGDHVLVVSERGGDGPTFLLVHGLGMGRDAYTEFIDALARRGHAIALDLPGFGDSPEPQRSLPIPQMADLVAQYLAESGAEPVVAIGHSMGTQVVAELAARHPELVRELVLIAPTVNARERTVWRQVLRMLQDLLGEHPKVIARGLVLYAKAGPAWFVRKFRTMMAHHIEEVAPQIGVPTLVMRGERDRVCPEGWVRSVAELIPDATLKQVPGKSHETMISSAEPVADLITEFARR
ncbi:pimeloyl-ACP methyl ester carboxylesterase [Homoserinimonas aerilata]|uniref:Pimeloyl-ACP methyl ester carboxylesterase n=1 Tax=Homoserinimonas aerilata TaxID=1162970 RepID=A0A542YJD4_9MICO|nr:alpha/beta hydrolase [Homoserinimonas aerilata]TQL48206.1 pimeloyl-ACP methyl ester carboxylesterase [Homoserinimonas aerilata]